MAQQRSRGRPNATTITGAREFTPDSNLAAYAKTAKAELDNLPAYLQKAQIEHVKNILTSERAQRRSVPSPLARIAFEVYSIMPFWVPLEQQLLSPERLERAQAVLAEHARRLNEIEPIRAEGADNE